MLHACIASIQNVERSLLLLVVSASDIPLHTIKFFYVVFSSAYWSTLQAVTNKHSMVRRQLCNLYCMVVGNCFCHFVVRTTSNQSIASGAWPTVSYTQLGSLNVFDTSHIQQSSIASYWTRIAICAYTPPAFDAPIRGFPVGISPSCLVWKN